MEDKMSFEELQGMVSICIDEIINLKQENEIVKKKNLELEKMVNNMLENQKTLINSVSQCFDNIETNRHFINHALDNIKYELQDDMEGEDKYILQFYDFNITIDGIVKEGKSLARFGDGEFAVMAPHDAHAPIIGNGTLRKICLKVLVKG